MTRAARPWLWPLVPAYRLALALREAQLRTGLKPVRRLRWPVVSVGNLSAGGHNPLEPAQFGVPIVMGPHYANFVAITDSLRAHDALRIAAKEDLASALVALLGDRPAAQAMGARAREVFERQAGATERCVAALRASLANGTESERDL